MATGRHKVLTGMYSARIQHKMVGGRLERVIVDDKYPDDGLTEFAVWTERDYPNNRTVVRKIEPFHPAKHYKGDMSGVIRAKDELDVYRFIESYNP